MSYRAFYCTCKATLVQILIFCKIGLLCFIFIWEFIEKLLLIYKVIQRYFHEINTVGYTVWPVYLKSDKKGKKSI